MICEFKGKKPKIHKTAFVHPAATVIGDVVIGEHSSVWPGAVLRGDFGSIRIGRYTCVQDNAVVHSADVYNGKLAYASTTVGDYVVVGHHALIHGAIVEDQCVIGGGAIVFNKARVAKGSLVGLSAVVLADAEVPPKTIVVGIPARPLRSLTDREFKNIKVQALNYAKLAKSYL
ncbi:MAG: gamma carbonic anhydrase family protein [Candidatus Hadarchaeota archaeon]